MSNTDQAPEPSMEEILSSIRRIISDDNDSASSKAEEAPEEESKAAEEPVEEVAVDEPEMDMEAALEAVDPEPEPANEENDDDDIFELTNVVEAEETSPEEAPAEDETDDMGGFGVADSGADVADDIEFVEVAVAEEPETMASPEPEIMALPEMGPEPVLEAEITDDAEAIDRLVSDGVGAAAAASFGDFANTLLSRGDGSTTVEELIQEMLRPLLKNWLDANLPNLVEKLVSEEIERIARRGR